MDILKEILIYSAKIDSSDKELKKLDRCLPEIVDWEKATDRLISSNTGSLFYVKIPKLTHADLIPKSTLKKLKQAYFQVLSRNVLINNLLQETIGLLAEKGIDVIVLKGAYLSEMLYKDVALRTLSDIDLLCKNEDEAREAYRLLIDAGYKIEKDDHMLKFLRENVEFVHMPQVSLYGIPVELHTRLHAPTEEYVLPNKAMWEHAKSYSMNDVQVFVPDLSDLLIYTCLHLDKHFKNGEIQLSWINDVVNILCVLEEQIDWHQLIGRTVLYKCEKNVFKFIMLAHKEYKAPVPIYIFSEYTSYLSAEDTELFHKYLSGFQGTHYSVTSGIKQIRTIKKKSARIKYVALMMFPSTTYMMRSYRIKNKHLVWFYYPYRVWLGVLGSIRTIRLRKRQTNQLGFR